MRFIHLAVFSFALFLLFAACNNEEDFITSGDVTLEFSVDTLRFDTVFTQLGSATRSIKVYNKNNRPIKISRVALEQGNNSSFRINVDGIPGNEAEEVIVYAEDSIYVFVEVTVDPDQPLSVSPYVITENLIFVTNGNRQSVTLEAWGQNANYFPSRFNKGVPVVLSCGFNEITWDDPKPYVIYGEVFIDSCTLNLPPGTRIYVHGGIAQNEVFGVFNDGLLYFLQNGKLKVNGTKENPVIIQGDRLETPFLDDPGQWTGIILGKGSKGNIISYATIRNSIFGIYADSTSEVQINNTQIYNTASSGIIGFKSRLTANNLLVYNNGSTSVNLLLGGVYNFNFCTIASYGVDASALSMSNFFCYDDFINCSIRAEDRLTANFRNSIIFGSRKDEIQLSDISGGKGLANFNIKLENCIVAVSDLLKEQGGLYAEFLGKECKPCINATRNDLLFVDPNADNYHLDSLSIAINQGQVIPEILFDLEGNPRDGMPDIGCFERQQ